MTSNITPLDDLSLLAPKLGIKGSLYLKREDMHPFKSHKGRSIPHMIDSYVAEGKVKFVISSSGNAAIAAAMYVKTLKKEGVKLTVYIGENITDEKKKVLEDLREPRIQIETVKRPLQEAVRLSNTGYVILRQSTDNLALDGYAELAKEIQKQCPKVTDIVFCTSSGASLVGTYKGFEKKAPKMHSVQTGACHPIVISFSPEKINVETPSLAQAIADKVGHRSKEVADIVKVTEGSGVVVYNKELEALKKIFMDFSYNALVSIAGAQKIQTTKDSHVVCIVGGN